MNGMTAEERFLEDLKARRTKGTVKSYRRGFELFLEYYGKNADTVLAERKKDVQSEDFGRVKRFDREVEKFYRWQLEKKYSLASARTNTLGICQFFKFYGFPINPEVPMPPMTTRTYIPSLEDLRRLFNVADIRSKTILSLGLDFSWRVSDFMTLKTSDLPSLDQQTPIPFSKVTQKERVLSSTFISKESVELLKAYLPTINPLNEYLFQTNGKNFLDEERINGIIKELVQKARLSIPQGQKLTFHSLRKRFLCTCYDLNIDSDIARLLVGKSIGSSMETYLGSANLKNSFIKVREENLSLSNGTIKTMTETKDKRIAELEKKLAENEAIMNTMVKLFGKEILEKAKKDMTFKVKAGKEPTPLEYLQLLAMQEKQRKDKEYEELLKNGNGA
jgi:integrase